MVKVLNIPLLALKNLISILGPKEKIDFSFCSKKCRRAVKICTRKDSVQVTVNYKSAKSYVSVLPSDSKKDVKLDTEKISEMLGLLNEGDLWIPSLVLPCADYICDVLNSQVYGIVFSNSSMAKLVNLQKWLESRQETLEYCEITESVPTNQLFYILDNFEAEFLSVDNTYFLDYEKAIKSKVLYMKNYSRVNLSHIEKSNLTKVELRSTLLARNEINEILRAWVRGSIPHLSLLVITGITNHNIMSLVDGIELTELGVNVRNRYKGIFNEPKVIAGGWTVRRSDGEMATIKIVIVRFSNKYSNNFCINS
ncbi:hypothetical protein CAEBREN_13015 [Caenorhabditis brenneri]|uniref:F-box domain-containing protein n=1 Tax=Caenorhabditis brenneri TaxID=135651 RepID=G0P117_CAEBE|nr:hypothetical protein CAEBREN_13015 [Caenorhabditis brenneri]